MGIGFGKIRYPLDVMIVLLILVPILTSCISGNRDQSHFPQAKPEYVSFQTVKKTLLFSGSVNQEQYVSSSGKELKSQIAELTRQNLYQVRLRAISIPQQEQLHRLMKGIFNSAGKTIPLTSGPLLAAGSPYAVSLEVYYPALRIADCHKGDNFARPGCVIAVNRALSLQYPDELRQGQDLFPAAGIYEERGMENLRSGKTPDLGASSDGGGGYGSD